MATFTPSTKDSQGNVISLATENFVNEQVVATKLHCNTYTDDKVATIIVVANAYADEAMAKAIQDVLPSSTELVTEYDKSQGGMPYRHPDTGAILIFRDESYIKSGDVITLQGAKAYTLEVQASTIQTVSTMISNSESTTLANANNYTDQEIIKLNNETDTKLTNLQTVLDIKITVNANDIDSLESRVSDIEEDNFSKERFVEYYNEFADSIYPIRLSPTINIDDYIQRFRFNKVTNARFEVINHHEIDEDTSTTISIVQHDALHNGVVWQHYGNLDVTKNTYGLYLMKDHKVSAEPIILINEYTKECSFNGSPIVTPAQLQDILSQAKEFTKTNTYYSYTPLSNTIITHRLNNSNKMTINVTGVPSLVVINPTETVEQHVRTADITLDVEAMSWGLKMESVDHSHLGAVDMISGTTTEVNLHNKIINGVASGADGTSAVNLNMLNDGIQTAKDYANSLVGTGTTGVSKSYVDNQDTSILAQAKSYSDGIVGDPVGIYKAIHPNITSNYPDYLICNGNEFNPIDYDALNSVLFPNYNVSYSALHGADLAYYITNNRLYLYDQFSSTRYTVSNYSFFDLELSKSGKVSLDINDLYIIYENNIININYSVLRDYLVERIENLDFGVLPLTLRDKQWFIDYSDSGLLVDLTRYPNSNSYVADRFAYYLTPTGSNLHILYGGQLFVILTTNSLYTAIMNIGFEPKHLPNIQSGNSDLIWIIKAR